MFIEIQHYRDDEPVSTIINTDYIQSIENFSNIEYIMTVHGHVNYSGKYNYKLTHLCYLYLIKELAIFPQVK